MYKGEYAENVNRAITEIIKPLADAGVKSVIAGGFMRDNALGRPYNDIDLYIAVGDWEDACSVLFGGSLEPSDQWWTGEREYDHASIGKQVEAPTDRMGGAVINLIERNGNAAELTPQNVVNTFNLGISMCATDGYTGLLDKRFLLDAADQKITLYRPDWGFEKSLKKWVKLQDKYPGWNLRLPSDFFVEA